MACARGLRPPFVITLAAAGALYGACSNPPPASDADAGADATFDGAAEASLDAGHDAVGADVARDATSEVAIDADTDARAIDCPKDDPGFGARSPCTAASTVRCAYADACASRPAGQDQNVYACIDDGGGAFWKLVSAAYVPPCPAAPPNEGDPCPCSIHLGYVSCNYGGCESITRAYASCRGVDTFDKEWHVVPLGCNPPEPDAAVDGDAPADASDGG